MRHDPASDSASLTGWRRWAFPLAAAVLIPALLLVLLELGLRLAGFGEPTSFFVPLQDLPADAPPAVTPNPRFGERFFPPEIARSPAPTRMARDKPEGTFRVFVLGGSAALGTPDSAFGLGRVLDAMLRHAYPERQIEVVNAAMTAINSHVVLTIARDAARYEPDLFVVYLGNNEVVGPYGPGTVFGGFSGSRLWIRTGIALQTTRVGQLARRVAARFAGGRQELAQWRGMEMFLERMVPETDPRLATVYAHLRENLQDLVDVAEDAGARVILASPAVRLTEPPFASTIRRDLAEAEKERFDQFLLKGREHVLSERPADALAPLQEALQIDDGHAEAQYLLGRALLALDRREDALEHLTRARDADALRFRADSQIQATIREVAEARQADGAAWVDGPAIGWDEHVFWEHVHLTFEGNARLAERVFALAAPLLAPAPPTPEPPSREALVRSLALSDWDLHRMAQEIFGMIRRPPFVAQAGHEDRVDELRRRVAALALAAWRGRASAEEVDRAVLAQRPDDLAVREQLATLLEDTGRPLEAAGQWGELLDRVPGVVAWRTRRAFALADGGKLETAEEILRSVLQEQPGAATRTNLGTVLEAQDETDAAQALYEQALAAEPAYEAARSNLAELEAKRGNLEEAERLVREGLNVDPGSARLHARLAGILERRGDLQAAAEAWSQALERDAEQAAWRNNLGFALERLGRTEEAIQAYLRALETDPTFPLPYFNLADLALERGRAAQAVPLYRAGLELAPGNDQARRNLALALEQRFNAPP